MEEENKNQNEKTLLDKGADAVKNKAKNKVGSWLMKLLPKILPFIGGFFLILLAAGLILVIQQVVLDIFSSILDIFNTTSSISSTSTETVQSLIYIDDNGAYKFKAEDASKQILEELESQKNNNNAMGLDTKALGDMIDKYIRAEIRTTYPRTGLSDSDEDGMIIIRRAFPDTGETKDLIYTSYNNFCNMVNTNPNEALTHFSLNPDTLELCIAERKKETVYTYFDGTTKSEGGGVTLKEIDYKKYVENHATPLNFLLTLHLISQDVKFMEDVLDLALAKGKTDPIVLTYVETISTSTTTYDYEGEITYSYEGTISEEELEKIKKENPDEEITNDNVADYYEVEYHEKTVKSYSKKWYVSNADTWLISSSKKISETPTPTGGVPNVGEPTEVMSEPLDSSDITIEDEDTDTDTDSDADADSDSDSKADAEETKTITQKSYITIREIITTTTSRTKYKVVDKEKEINVDEFVDLIRKYPKVENNFSTAPSNIFYLLQQNENTQIHEKLMRFVLYKLTDIDYGVTEESLEDILSEKLDKTTNGGIPQSILEAALKVHNDQRHWIYCAEHPDGKASLTGGSIELALANPKETTCCATYVSSVLYVAGYFTEEEISKWNYNSPDYLSEKFNELKWEKITNEDELQAGDIVFLDTGGLLDGIDHVQIYAGDNKWYNAGNTADIQGPAPVERSNWLDWGGWTEWWAYRPPTLDGFTASNEDYIEGYYKSQAGRTFTILNQIEIDDSYSGWRGYCNRAAAAIIASGYSDETPTELIEHVDDYSNDPIPVDAYWSDYGLKRGDNLFAMSTDTYVEILREHLQKGGYAAIWVNKDPHYYGLTRQWTSGSMHWVAILDYKEENGEEKIRIADWHGTEWYPIDEFSGMTNSGFEGISNMVLIEEEE